VGKTIVIYLRQFSSWCCVPKII